MFAFSFCSPNLHGFPTLSPSDAYILRTASRYVAYAATPRPLSLKCLALKCYLAASGDFPNIGCPMYSPLRSYVAVAMATNSPSREPPSPATPTPPLLRAATYAAPLPATTPPGLPVSRRPARRPSPADRPPLPCSQAVACMECELRFTVIRRRHHCRACGRLLCSDCCSERICLDYMEFSGGRVCSRCKRTIDRGETGLWTVESRVGR